MGFQELSARLETIETTLRSTLLDTMAEVRATSKEVKAISETGKSIHHPDLEESLPDGVPIINGHSDVFRAGEPPIEQLNKTEPAPPTSQDLLRRLKRGYLLQYERDDDERDETRSLVPTTNFVDVIKREARFFVHYIQIFSFLIRLLPPISCSGVWHLRGRPQERHRRIEGHTPVLALLRWSLPKF
jgi:hypothetical protein